MRVVFAGSAEFSLPVLRALAASDQELVKVLTAPDRAGSRGAAAPRPVKAAAESLGIPIAQPPRLTEDVWHQVSSQSRADVLVVAAYGQLIPLSVLDSLRQGGLGVHPSLLPRHRGASPVVAAILAGDSRTGVTVFRMVQHLDSGPILGQAELPLGGSDTTASLSAKLAELGGDVAVQVLRRLEAGGVTEIAQLESAATYSHRLSRQDGRLDWTFTAEIIDRHLRALSPWPGVTVPLSGKQVKLLRGAPDPSAQVARQLAPGEILQQGQDWILVQTLEGAYRVELIQPPGGPQMSPAAFLRGRQRAPRGHSSA
ncbi:MAG: methionyl-tRNA formyltransferase [Candidatus Dormiibacterota bacterium]